MSTTQTATTLSSIPIYVFTGKNFVNTVQRHNIVEADTIIARDGGTKIFGSAVGGNVTGGCKYSKPSIGFERDKYLIVQPERIVENPLKGLSMFKTGAGGASALPTDGKKSLMTGPVAGTDMYLVGQTANGYPGSGLHKPGWGAEDETNCIGFDLGSTQFVGTLNLYWYTPVSTQARFVYYKVKTSTDNVTYTYSSGRVADSSANDFGWSKSSGFPTPTEAFADELRPTSVVINKECRYIKIYTDGSSNGLAATPYDTTQSNVDKMAYLYEAEISNCTGYREIQKNFICFKRQDDGITDISGVDLASGIDIIFKDVGDSAYCKIKNNLTYDIFIYSLELFGLWILKASEADNINGSVRSVNVSPNSTTDLFSENTIAIQNDKVQFAEYADRLGLSLLNSNDKDRMDATVHGIKMDLMLPVCGRMNLMVSELSSNPIKSITREKTYKLSRDECSVSLKLAEDVSL